MKNTLRLLIALSAASSSAAYSESRFSLSDDGDSMFPTCFEPSLLDGDCRVTYRAHQKHFAYFKKDDTGQWVRYQLVAQTGCKSYGPVPGVIEESHRPDDLGPTLRHILQQRTPLLVNDIHYKAFPRLFKNSDRRVIVALFPNDSNNTPTIKTQTTLESIRVVIECPALGPTISLENGSFKIMSK